MNRLLSVWLLSALMLFGCAAVEPGPGHDAAIPDTAAANASTNEIDASARQAFLTAADPAALAVLRFWYEEWDQDMVEGGHGRYNDKWFPHGPKGAAGSAEVDQEIRDRFLDTFELAASGRLDWAIGENPYENLAYIILIDQFSRNMFRGKPRAYEHDDLARNAARINIDKGFYRYYFTGYQRLFVVYPLMHHENLESQTLSLRLLKAINEYEDHRYEFLNAMDKGVEHYQMIFMFGRFPHRNERLGRSPTVLEQAYQGKQGTKGFVDGSKW